MTRGEQLPGEQPAIPAPPAVRGVRRGRFTVTRLYRGGPDPHRVLLMGGQSQLAPNRMPQAEALGERIADRIWLRTRRGVDLDMLWELRPVLRAIHQGLSSWRLWRYDAVIIVSQARATGPFARWHQRAADRVLQRVLREVGTASHVLVVSLDEQDPPADVHAATGPADGTPRISTLATSSDARTGADAVAARLMEPLRAADAAGEREGGMDAAHRRRERPDDEEGRRRAVERLALQEDRLGRRLRHVVALAKDAFASSSAAILLVDQEGRWTVLASDEASEDPPRPDRITGRSIGDLVPTVIGDTWDVPALQGDPVVAGPRPLRFYAAHPIESIEGYRIGALCIWDTAPHEVNELGTGALRDLALLAEAEIIGAGGR